MYSSQTARNDVKQSTYSKVRLVVIGYVRVSTQAQNPGLQFDRLLDAGREEMFHERASRQVLRAA